MKKALEVGKLDKVIRSKKDAQAFLSWLPDNEAFSFFDEDARMNVCREWAITQIERKPDWGYTIYSFWPGGRDIKPTCMDEKHAVNWVWRHRADINKVIRQIIKANKKEAKKA